MSSTGPNAAGWVTAASTALLTLGVVVTGIQYRNQQRSLRAESTRQLAERWESPEMREVWHAIAAKLHPHSQ